MLPWWQSGAYLTADCDGDGVTMKRDRGRYGIPGFLCILFGTPDRDTSPITWNGLDCDGDGVTNEDEKTDGTDPLDPCDYNPQKALP